MAHSAAPRDHALTLLREGKSRAEVARELDLHWSTVDKWAREAGVDLQPRPLTPRERAFRLVRLGFPDSVTARIVGVTTHTVWSWRRAAGVPPASGERAEVIRRLLHGGRRGNVSARTGVDRARVARWAREAGLKIRARQTDDWLDILREALGGME